MKPTNDDPVLLLLRERAELQRAISPLLDRYETNANLIETHLAAQAGRVPERKWVALRVQSGDNPESAI